jgi:hypothetical protein
MSISIGYHFESPGCVFAFPCFRSFSLSFLFPRSFLGFVTGVFSDVVSFFDGGLLGFLKGFLSGRVSLVEEGLLFLASLDRDGGGDGTGANVLERKRDCDAGGLTDVSLVGGGGDPRRLADPWFDVRGGGSAGRRRGSELVGNAVRVGGSKSIDDAG